MDNENVTLSLDQLSEIVCFVRRVRWAGESIVRDCEHVALELSSGEKADFSLDIIGNVANKADSVRDEAERLWANLQWE